MKKARGFWPMRDLPLVGWLVAAFVVSLVHNYLPAPRWLLIHLVVLGAAGHAILVWSRYFADTLRRLPNTPRGEQNIRLIAFNVGVIVVIAGVLPQHWQITLVGAVLIVAAVGWHVIGLIARDRQKSLGSRFASTNWYYVTAGTLLPIGVGLGVWLSGDPGEPWHSQARMAHIAINVLGWIGLTVLGTLTTLWPTMLRTKIDPEAERASRWAIWLLVVAIAITAAASLLGFRLGVTVGLGLYAGGVIFLALPAARAAKVKPPSHFPEWSVLAGIGWLVASLLVMAIGFGFADDWPSAVVVSERMTPFLAAGFVAQVLLGALSYLIPVVLGGGPAAVRATTFALDRGWSLRIVLVNLGLLVCALPVPMWVRVFVSVLVLGGLAAFIPLLFVAIRASRRAKGAPGQQIEIPQPRLLGPALTGLALILVATAAGVAVDPSALKRGSDSAAAGIASTGHTTTVEVTTKGMRFVPDRVRMPAGDRLVIKFTNASAGDVHDLVLETGHETGRIKPGAGGRLVVPIVGKHLDGWCSVVGHKQMGMVFKVDVIGATAAPKATSAPKAADPHAHHQMAEPDPDHVARDAVLPPLGDERVHRLTFTVGEHKQEVAPGITQELWTYNGTAPGPTLHGRVGDVFEITLVNDGTIGHSIDFHAGALAPDQPMRTLPPGESLIYRFTATRAGIWMYHCSSMPMSAHVAAGLFGAVIIEPDDLAPVDRSYVLVQSEQYYGKPGGTVDMDKIAAEKPDAVVFNGYPNQYDVQPLPARVGERVRIWLLDAGPNRSLSFHIVGGQFDRVWAEDDYQLGTAKAPAVGTGSQALGLLAAQGGFVELTFPEAGHYPFVNHQMIDAERGAHGVVEVK